jgi:riboflavin synthase
MFTGIIESIGTVESLQNDILKIRTVNNKFFNLEFGTSIAIDGCCLTLKDYEQDLLCFQVSDETLSRTSLKDSHCGYVNMELPLTIDSFLSGHLVQGHVDEVINLKTIEKLESELWNFTFSNASNKYLVDKGSITINGISLTVIEPDEDTFTVAIIEETFNRTNLKT